MNALQLIKEEIIPLSLKDTASKALSLMNDYKVSHFPVTENDIFIGVIAEENIYNIDNTENKLQKELLNYDNLFVNEQQYVNDVLKLIDSQKLSLVPVIDDKGKYVGCITQKDIINYFAKSMSINSPGGIIMLEVNINDYSLTEIANIVESNDAKALSVNIVSNINSTKLEIVLKVNILNINRLIQTFERYNYQINASFGEEINYADIKENYDSLMNYLKV